MDQNMNGGKLVHLISQIGNDTTEIMTKEHNLILPNYISRRQELWLAGKVLKALN